MSYNFDKIIDRRNTNSASMEGFRGYLFEGYENLNFKYPDDELIKMWVADMEFETAPEILDAIHKRLDHGILGYTMVFDPSYNQAITNWIENRHGYRFKEEHIVGSKGVIPALFSLVSFLCGVGDKALIMTPSYAFFKYAADANNTECVYTKLIPKEDRFVMDFEDIDLKTKDPKLTTLIFCNPHNPTGQLWTEEELKKLGDICFKNNVTIISDEIHCDILRRGKTFTPFQKIFPNSDKIVTCISASKTFNLAGLLMANVIIPNDQLRQQWTDNNLPIENPLSLAAYKAAYTSGADWLEELTDYLDKNFATLSEFIKTHLPYAKFYIPDSTYLAWIDVSHYFPKETDLTLYFAEHAGILLEGGNMFLHNADGFIRLNLACPKSKLEEGLKRIKTDIDERKEN